MVLGIGYLKDLYLSLRGVPSQAELDRISNSWRLYRQASEREFGRDIVGHLPSDAELVCESRQSYHNYMMLEKALRR
jgi:hypothetical protein